MPTFKEMDPEVIWRLIEGQEDVLTPAAKERDALYARFTCPRCKCALVKEFDARTCFSSDDLVPHAILSCPVCGYTVEPHTNVVVSFGDASKVPVESSPLILPSTLK